MKAARGGSRALVEARLYKPTARECALLLLHLIATKDEELGREVTRLRVAEITLRRLWGRARLSPELIEEVSDWLLGAGVALFFAGSTYAVIRTTVVESWTRASSKRIKSDLQLVAEGRFDFSQLESLLSVPVGSEADE